MLVAAEQVQRVPIRGLRWPAAAVRRETRGWRQFEWTWLEFKLHVAPLVGLLLILLLRWLVIVPLLLRFISAICRLCHAYETARGLAEDGLLVSAIRAYGEAILMIRFFQVVITAANRSILGAKFELIEVRVFLVNITI